jgi:YesN/AraC family two-component response regulator
MEDIKILKETLKDIKVLFVDDEEDIRNGTGSFLKKFFDNVTICSNGEEGLQSFKENQDIQVVISDILMPKMTGSEMIAEIKKIKPNIFVIYISASRGAEFKEESNCEIFVKKPLAYNDMKDILIKIKEAV